VSGATLVATHVDSNYRYTARSNEAGNYNIPSFGRPVRPAGAGARIQGIGRPDIRLVSLDVRRIDIRLELGPFETGSKSWRAKHSSKPRRANQRFEGREALKTLPMNTRLSVELRRTLPA